MDLDKVLCKREFGIFKRKSIMCLNVMSKGKEE